jgi:hypothetical protein
MTNTEDNRVNVDRDHIRLLLNIFLVPPADFKSAYCIHTPDLREG